MTPASATSTEDIYEDAEIVMFTLDDKIDRRILLETESLEGEGYCVRVVSPATIKRQYDGNADWVPDFLRLYRSAAFRRAVAALGWQPYAARALFWRFHRRPDEFFRRMFGPAIARFRSNIYVAHDLPMLPVATAAAARHGGQVVYDSHELYCEQGFGARETRMWAKVEADHIKAADRVITINDSIAAELARRYGIPTPAVVRNCERSRSGAGQEAGRYFHSHFGLAPRFRIVLYQGGLLPNRNLDALATAFDELRDTDLCLILLGDGPLRQALEALRRRHGLEGHVFLHEAVEQDRLLDLTASADVGVIPYQPSCLNTTYCTPNKLFEFIAARIPVIATDLPEIRKIVQGYDVGLVGDTSCPHAIAGLIRSFFEPEGGASRFTAQLACAAAELSWDRESRRLLDVYRRLAAPGNKAGPA